MDSNNRGAGRTVTCSAPEKLDCVLPGLLAVGAVWVLCGACGRVQVIWCYGYPNNKNYLHDPGLRQNVTPDFFACRRP